MYGTLVGVAEGRDLYPWVHVMMTRLNRVAVDGVCVMVEVVVVVVVVMVEVVVVVV